MHQKSLIWLTWLLNNYIFSPTVFWLQRPGTTSWKAWIQDCKPFHIYLSFYTIYLSACVVCLFSPISFGHHWSGGGKIHGSPSQCPARISQQHVLTGPPQHTPLRGTTHINHTQRMKAPDRQTSHVDCGRVNWNIFHCVKLKWPHDGGVGFNFLSLHTRTWEKKYSQNYANASDT